jgi:hypothetical protein
MRDREKIKEVRKGMKGEGVGLLGEPQCHHVELP